MQMICQHHVWKPCPQNIIADRPANKNAIAIRMYCAVFIYYFLVFISYVISVVEYVIFQILFCKRTQNVFKQIVIALFQL